MVPALATRLAGSADLYQTSQRFPWHSINFITSHDGFTLWDLVSYNQKHNEANGEDNRDGDNDNHSWNCGTEGPTDDPAIERLRQRQVRNFLTLLLLARGVPMLLAGDEMARSQQGNNNAYCQDNGISWLDWRNLERNASLLRYVQGMIAFRKRHPLIRHGSFIPEDDGSGPCISWHGTRLHRPDWSEGSRSLAMHISGWTRPEGRDEIYLIANAYWEGMTFELPQLGAWRWCRFVDTQLAGGEEISEPGAEPPLPDQTCYPVGPRSVVVLVGSGR